MSISLSGSEPRFSISIVSLIACGSDVYKRQIKLTIEIENLGSEPLSDIDITREIPPQWEFKPGLDYSIMDDMLIWRIPRLEINQIMTLELEPTISISSTEAVESGEIVAKYQSPGLISGLVPNSLRLLRDTYHT